MPTRDIFVIGASAGGVEALTHLFRALPADFPGSLFVVLHTLATGESRLPQILNRAGNLTAKHPESGESIVPGTVYVARPNYHLVIEDGRVQSITGPRHNQHRPSVNALFESAARSWGDRVVGIVLSGSLDDGTLGLLAIKQAGGLAIVQDPEDAMFPGMPANALHRVDVDFRGSVSEIASRLIAIAQTGKEVTSASMEHNEQRAPLESSETSTFDLPDNAIGGFTCPQCGSVLREIETEEHIHFRCHVGHRVSERSLLHAQGEEVENALWAALRVLEERIHLGERVARRASGRGNDHIARHFEQQNRDAREKMHILRRVLLGSGDVLPVTSLQDEVPNSDAAK